MGELINGKTPEEIKRVLEWANCECGDLVCEKCQYYESVCTRENFEMIAPDALALIEHLEAERDAALKEAEKQKELVELNRFLLDAADKALEEAEKHIPKWIDAEERLPEEKESVLVHYADGWMPIAFLLGGKWYQNSGDTSWLSVTHWMYMPEPPKEGE